MPGQCLSEMTRDVPLFIGTPAVASRDVHIARVQGLINPHIDPVRRDTFNLIPTPRGPRDEI